MTPTNIQACYARANEVLNGFKNPSERNARDVIALIKHINGLKQAQQVEKEPSKSEDILKKTFGV